jgi:hypothetical protein
MDEMAIVVGCKKSNPLRMATLFAEISVTIVRAVEIFKNVTEGTWRLLA